MSRRVVVVLAALLTCALLVGACGDDKKKSSSSSSKASTSKDPKVRQVAEAEKAFDKTPNDLNSCKNLALSYVSLASPTSTGKKGESVKMPKDSEKNKKKAAETYERCAEIAPKDLEVQRSLAFSYLAIGKHEDASPILEKVAKSGKQDATKANDYYAWGLAASNVSTDENRTQETIAAWEQFLKLSPKNDPRLEQVRKSLELLKADEAKKAKAKK